MRPMTIAERSFGAGYRYGLSDGATELSLREAQTRFPDVPDHDAFAQGMLDGLAGDDWRHRCVAEHIASGNNMDSVLFMEVTDREGRMEHAIGHGSEIVKHADGSTARVYANGRIDAIRHADPQTY